MSNPTSAAAINAEQIGKALQQLHDIVEPIAPAFWPPAPGWYFLGAALLLLLAMAGVGWWRRWQANAYRREALRELAALRDDSQSVVAPQQRITALVSLLRRVALHGDAREQVAGLSGVAWIEYLSTRSMLSPGRNVEILLCHGPYANFGTADGVATNHLDDLNAAYAYVGEWIKRHRVTGQVNK